MALLARKAAAGAVSSQSTRSAAAVSSPTPSCSRVASISGSVAGQRTLPVACASTMDKEEQQMRAAEVRWENAIREGKIRNVACKDVSDLLKEGWIVLDVRPYTETKKAQLENAVEVPLFVPDTSLNPGSLLKQMSNFGMGGWWLGGTHMIPNTNFLQQVLARVPKDAKVIVACQKGLRSLAACEQLSRAGYSTIAWINGGFDTARPGDLPTKNGVDVRYAGIGGLSELLGWTEVQQEDTKGFAGGFENILKFAAFLVFLDGLVFAYEQVKYLQAQ